MLIESQACTMTRHETLKLNRQRLHQKIKDRCNTLYNVKRLRPDDVYKQVGEEFCISAQTVEKIFNKQS